VQQINDKAEEIELEELISMVESGKDENGETIDSTTLNDIEQRILYLDSMVRRKKKAISSKNR
jgi:hypothetical protein